jgi:hypothetical protein
MHFSSQYIITVVIMQVWSLKIEKTISGHWVMNIFKIFLTTKLQQ